MAWVQFKLATTAELAEQWSDVLLALGANAVTFHDQDNQAIFEPTPGTMPMWQELQLVALYPHDVDVDAVTGQIRTLLGPNLALQIETLADQDWQETWKQDLKPMQFGERLWICPSWCAPPCPTAINIMLDPGMAFGTGTHPTTAMCLEWLAQNIQPSATVLDFGCGSGILAIAAIKLGANFAYCVDCDSQALLSAAENASKNAISAQQLITMLPEQLPSPLQVDTVVANILANPLSELAHILASYVKDRGNIVLSGILLNQVDPLLAIYRQWFTDFTVTTQAEWVRIVGTKVCK